MYERALLCDSRAAADETVNWMPLDRYSPTLYLLHHHATYALYHMYNSYNSPPSRVGVHFLLFDTARSIYRCTSLLQRAQCSHCKRCISYGNSVRPSVCLSVCPSHAGIVSKRRHVARCSLHRTIKCSPRSPIVSLQAAPYM